MRSMNGVEGETHALTIAEIAATAVAGIITSTVTRVRSGSQTNRFTGGEASPPPPKSDSKPEWRAWARSVAFDVGAVGAAVRGHLDAFLPDDAVVLTYLAMAGEIDPRPDTRSRTFLATRTPPRGVLTIHAADGELERHPYGFQQPAEGSPEWEGPIDVVLLPGLAFARDGMRLGRGAGHYDRLLSRRRIPMRVGITTDGLLVDHLPSDPHDVPATHVATESGVVVVPR